MCTIQGNVSLPCVTPTPFHALQRNEGRPRRRSNLRKALNLCGEPVSKLLFGTFYDNNLYCTVLYHIVL